MRQALQRPRGNAQARRHGARSGLAVLSAGFAVAGLLGPAKFANAEDGPSYLEDRRGVFLPFLNAPQPGEAIAQSPRLGLSFGGAVRPVLVDTGSTGIVVSASRIPDNATLPSQPGRITYTSSGRIMIGRWIRVPVILWGRDGESVATRPIPVLAVDRIACTAQARHCTAEEAPEHVAMLGIGFGREDDSQSQSTPDTNPLLNAEPSGPGAIRRGYVLTARGVHVGLTRANTRGRYRFVKLDPHPRVPGDWLGVPVCISVDGREPGACGRALLDTGATAMFLTLPPSEVATSLQTDATGHSALLPGTRLRFRFGAAAAYTVTVGDHATGLAPERIVLNTTRPQPFVNTGLHVLNGFDVLFDADRGYYGFRARGAVPDADQP
jgi:predicted aspartyl protease